jgi:hypothetical protein
MIFLVIIGWALYAWFDAKEEAAWSWPFRNFDWQTFESMKGSKGKQAHRYGAAGVFIMLVLTAYVFFLAEDKWEAIPAAFLLCGLTYWLVFDIAYALTIGQKWFYLGSTASTDRIVKNGKVKAYACALIIAAGLTAYLLFM